MTLTVGSLFSGIGGLELGLERAGMRTAWQVEIDPYARRVLEKHWPDVPRFEDVCTVGADQLAPVDLICGGFPCQDISNAGLRAGIAGERSGLWAEYARIVRLLRPRYVLVENVAALLARGLGRVLGDLAACGYDAEWDCVPAAAVGAPHRRDRLFVVAYSKRDALRQQPEPVAWSSGATVAGDDRAHVAHADGARLEGPRVRGPTPERRGDVADASIFGCSPGAAGGSAHAPEPDAWWAAEPDVGRVADGVPARVDRLRTLGNAVVPQVAEYIGRRIVAFEEARRR